MTSSSSVNTSTIDRKLKYWKILKGLRSRNQTSLPSPPAGHQKRHLMILDVQLFGLFGIWPCYRLLPSHVSRCSSICSLSWLRFGRFQDHLYLATSRKACCLKQNECRNKPCHMLSINVNHLWTYLLHSASLFVHGSTLGYDSILVPVFLLSLPIPFPTVLRYVLPQFFTNVSSPFSSLPFCHYFPLYFLLVLLFLFVFFPRFLPILPPMCSPYLPLYLFVDISLPVSFPCCASLCKVFLFHW